MGSSPLSNLDMSFFRSFRDSFINNSSPVIASSGPILGLLMVSPQLRLIRGSFPFRSSSPLDEGFYVRLVSCAACLDSRSAIPATSPLFYLMV